MYAVAMAIGRGAKKSTHKGKRKGKNGPSSSLVRKTKSNEVTGVSELNVLSPILEKLESLGNEMEEVEMVISSVTLADHI